MALRNLTPETMITVSARWLDPKRDRPIFDKLPLLQALLPVIEDSHRALVTGQHLASSAATAVEEIRGRQKKLDNKHDRKIRGTHLMLSGLAELADNPGEATSFLDLRDRLLPDGRRATQRSYVDQAGDAIRLPERIGDDDRIQLETVQTPWGTLAAEVDVWMQAAHEIGLLEDERADLEQKATEDEVTPAHARAIQNEWIRVARAVESNLAVAPGATDEIRERVLGPLYRAEARADRREAARSDDAPGKPPGDEPGDESGDEPGDAPDDTLQAADKTGGNRAAAKLRNKSQPE